MADSILDSVKKMVGLDASYTVFDLDIITHINSTFSVLSQLGVGPVDGFAIEDKTANWTDYLLGSPNLLMVRSYMFLKVRSLFDPPATSFALEANAKLIAEYEWRINISEFVPGPGLPPNYGTIWNLSGGKDFPEEAFKGEIGVDFETGDVWENTDGETFNTLVPRVDPKVVASAVQAYIADHPITGNTLLESHLADTTPHPVYDELPTETFITYLRNGMAG